MFLASFKLLDPGPSPNCELYMKESGMTSAVPFGALFAWFELSSLSMALTSEL